MMERVKCGKKGTAHHTTASVKHSAGSVMAWTCMAAKGTGSLAFTDDSTAGRSYRMNAEIYRSTVCSDTAEGIKTHWLTSYHSATIPHTMPKKTKCFSGWRGGLMYAWLINNQLPDWAESHLLKTRLKVVRPTTSKSWSVCKVKVWDSSKDVSADVCGLRLLIILPNLILHWILLPSLVALI